MLQIPFSFGWIIVIISFLIDNCLYQCKVLKKNNNNYSNVRALTLIVPNCYIVIFKSIHSSGAKKL